MWTHWLSMTSILFVIRRIYDKQLKRNSRRNKDLLNDVLLDFWNLHQILNILKKKKTLRAPVLPNLWIVKHVVRWIFKIPVSQHSSKMNMIKGPKHCWNLQDRCFTRFFHQFAGACVVKSLLVICKALGLFVNILTANGKYSLLLFLLYSIFNVSLQ